MFYFAWSWEIRSEDGGVAGRPKAWTSKDEQPGHLEYMLGSSEWSSAQILASLGRCEEADVTKQQSTERFTMIINNQHLHFANCSRAHDALQTPATFGQW